MTISLSESSLFFRNALTDRERISGSTIRDLVSEQAFRSVARFMRKLIFVKEVNMEPGASFRLQHTEPCLHMVLPVTGNMEVHAQANSWKLMPDDLWQWHSHQQHKALLFNTHSSASRFIHIGWSELDGETKCLPFDVETLNELSHLRIGNGLGEVKMGLGVFTSHQNHRLQLENEHRSGLVLCIDGQCKVGGELLATGDVLMFKEHDVLNFQSTSNHCFLLTLESSSVLAQPAL